MHVHCYAEQSTPYTFLVLWSDVFDYNTIVETKNVEFYEDIYPLFEKIFHAHVGRNTDKNIDKTPNEGLRSKRAMKEFFFGGDYYTYFIDSDPMTYFNAISFFDAFFLQNKTWELVDLPPRAKPISCN